MAVLGAYAKILVDEFDFSGDSNSVEGKVAAAELENTRFQATGQRFDPGLVSSTLSHAGYFSGPGAGELEQELHARLGSNAPVIVAALLGTQTPGCPAYVSESGWGQQLALALPVASLVTVTGSWPQAMGLQRGVRLADGVVSATGGLASVDLGAAGADGGRAWLFVQAIVGSVTDAEIDIESSADDASWDSEGTFTVNAVGAQALALTGTIGRYVRVNVTTLGGATSLRVVAVAAIQGVTQ